MAETPSILGSAIGASVVAATLAPDIKLSEAGSMVLVKFPAVAIEAAQLGGTAVVSSLTPEVQASQLGATVVVRGRIASPRLRAWGFNLDGHSFYVLRLGDGKTLVWDKETGQWSHWSSGTADRWRASTGFNWDSPQGLANDFGSNVLVGDDTYGHLWFLDPEQGYDDPAVEDGPPSKFPRVAVAQMTTPRRETIPAYEAYLTASAGYPALDGTTVTLSYSDDVGATYVSAGTLTPTVGAYTQEFAWRSLGLVTYPGRIFKISDDGAFARIDGLDIWDGSTA